ncbi:unnamed protein product, partial [Cladocopium goreaui]
MEVLAESYEASASDSGPDVQVKGPVQTALKSSPKDAKAVDFQVGELQQEKLRLSSEVERLRRKLNRFEAVDPHAAAVVTERPNPRSLRTSLEDMEVLAESYEASAPDSGADVQVKGPVQTALKSSPKDAKAVDFQVGELQQEKLRLSSEVERLRRKLNRFEAVDPHAAAVVTERPNPRSLCTSLEDMEVLADSYEAPNQRRASEAEAGPEIVQAVEPRQGAASIVESDLGNVQVKGPVQTALKSDAKESDQRRASDADAGPETVQEPRQEAASIIESVLDSVQ